MKPPTASASNEANSIEVPSSHMGATIWTPAGRPTFVRPMEATVAGRPASVAKHVQRGVFKYARLPSGVPMTRCSSGSL
jgi:hypothetical protein